jgi:hypothetical protein
MVPRIVAAAAKVLASLAQAPGIHVERLHITYEPAAAGRQSFGGHLIEQVLRHPFSGQRRD